MKAIILRNHSHLHMYLKLNHVQMAMKMATLMAMEVAFHPLLTPGIMNLSRTQAYHLEVINTQW